MSIKITPVGTKIIVAPIKKEDTQTDSGITVADYTVDSGEVVEVSDYLKNIYKKGDIVIYPSGAGTTQYYNKRHCLFLNGQEYPQGDVWGILTVSISNDKGDSL